MTVNIFKLPGWTERLPNNARINAKEMSKILGYKRLVESRLINKKLGIDGYDCSISGERVGPAIINRVGWRVGDLRKIEGKEI